MRAIDPSGNIVDTDQVWWWQLPDSATPAEVRQACFRNALSEVACSSRTREVNAAISEARRIRIRHRSGRAQSGPPTDTTTSRMQDHHGAVA